MKYLILTVLVWGHVHCALSCSCLADDKNSTILDKICDAAYTYAAKVRVTGILVKDEDPNSDTVYSIKVKEVYRQPFDVKIKHIEELITPGIGGLCGVSLKLKTIYLLSGTLLDGKLYIQQCQVLVEWGERVSDQDKAFLGRCKTNRKKSKCNKKDCCDVVKVHQ